MPNTSKRVLLAVVLAAIACGSLTRITVNQTATATIPGATLLEQLAGDLAFGGLGSFDISNSAEFKNQGVKKEQINSVKLKALTLTITSPSNGDFTFLDGLSFFVEAGGVAKKEIAKGGPFPAGQRSVSLTLLDVELAPYATAASMTFTTVAKGKKPSSTTTVEAKVTLDADVNVGGLICGR